MNPCMNRKWTGSFVAALLLLVGCSSPLAADTVVFSNTSGSFCNCGFPIFGGIPPGSFAAEFTPGGNLSFTDAKLGIDGAPGAAGSLNVYLETNSGGQPGSLIEQVGSNVAIPANSSAYITANSFSTPISLLSGVSYWLVAAPATGGTNVIWDFGGTSSVPTVFSVNNGLAGPWISDGSNNVQFQIDGTSPTTSAVPEPGSLLLFGSGLLGLTMLVLRKKQFSV